jgi:hypothetical protein
LYLLASALPTDSSSLPALLALNSQANQLASGREERTTACVTKPLAIGHFDVAVLAELVDSGRADDTIETLAGASLRVEGTPGVVEGGPGKVDDEDPKGLPQSDSQLGIAV